MSNKSLNFLGNATSYISVPPTNLSFGTGDFTIEWWQYETDSNPFPRPFSIGSFSTAQIAVSFESGDFLFWSNGSSPSSYSLPTYKNEWVHFAIVRQSGNITIYLNGILITSSPVSDTTNYVFSQNLTIGNETTPNTVSAFGGQIYNFEWLVGTAKYWTQFTPSTNLPSDPNSYALILNGNYSGGTESENVSNVNVGESSNTPVVTPPPPPPPPVPPPPITGLNINPLNKRFGSISFGSFWYGNSTNFPGFLYKKNVGVGGRRSTKMAAGGNVTCNSSTYLYNKYKPGSSGVGASSIANRRAKNRHATVCSGQKCFPCYMTLGQYSNYTHNPNGYVPCAYNKCFMVVGGNIKANMNIDYGMTELTFFNPDIPPVIPPVNPNDDGYAYLPFAGMDFFFFGTNYGNSDGTMPAKSIYMNTNSAFGFGEGQTYYATWPTNMPAILFDFFNSYIFESYVSTEPQNGKVQGSKYVRIVYNGTDIRSYNDGETTSVKKAYEIYYVRDLCHQYMVFNCSIEKCNIPEVDGGFDRSGYDAYFDGVDRFANISNITNGTAFQNTLGSTEGSFGLRPPNNLGPQGGGSYILRSDLNGNNWQFFPNSHLIF